MELNPLKLANENKLANEKKKKKVLHYRTTKSIYLRIKLQWQWGNTELCLVSIRTAFKIHNDLENKYTNYSAGVKTSNLKLPPPTFSEVSAAPSLRYLTLYINPT